MRLGQPHVQRNDAGFRAKADESEQENNAGSERGKIRSRSVKVVKGQ